jgi:thiol-disulfide isomerase/thioredoxin
MRRSHTWLTLAALGLIATLALDRLGQIGRSAETMTEANPAMRVPGLVLPDLKGQPQSLAQWQGKVLIVNYWATWCLPCREEMPGFSRLQDKYRDKGVQFVGISIDSVDKIVEFQKATRVSYPLLVGDMTAMENSAQLGNTRQALPFTAVFDREGRLSATKLGRLSEPELEKQLAVLISR